MGPRSRIETADVPLREIVAALSSLIEDAVQTALPDGDDPELADFGAVRLVEAMRYSMVSPGKRIRPLLLLATVRTLGRDVSDFLRFAVGLEMIHAYSLIHDDLPAMDDDDLRRGHPTNHKVFGEGMAILAGDALLTEAFAMMLKPVAPPVLQMRVVAEVATAAGKTGMVGGQAADLLAESKDPGEDLVRSIHARKTGRLIRAAVRAGALLTLAEEGLVQSLTRFAEHFGLAFQIADDIKDEVLPPERTGKAQGGDRAANKMTFPACFGLERSRGLCRQETELAIDALADVGERSALLAYIARDAVRPALEPSPRG